MSRPNYSTDIKEEGCAWCESGRGGIAHGGCHDRLTPHHHTYVQGSHTVREVPSDDCPRAMATCNFCGQGVPHVHCVLSAPAPPAPEKEPLVCGDGVDHASISPGGRCPGCGWVAPEKEPREIPPGFAWHPQPWHVARVIDQALDAMETGALHEKRRRAWDALRDLFYPPAPVPPVAGEEKEREHSYFGNVCIKHAGCTRMGGPAPSPPNAEQGEGCDYAVCVTHKPDEERAALLACLAEWEKSRPSTCIGEWVSGSGGHRNHTPGCTEDPVWFDPGDPYAYCDKHAPKQDIDRGYIWRHPRVGPR